MFISQIRGENNGGCREPRTEYDRDVWTGDTSAPSTIYRALHQTKGFGEQLVGAAAVGVFVGHGGDHDFVHAGLVGQLP